MVREIAPDLRRRTSPRPGVREPGGGARLSGGARAASRTGPGWVCVDQGDPVDLGHPRPSPDAGRAAMVKITLLPFCFSSAGKSPGDGEHLPHICPPNSLGLATRPVARRAEVASLARVCSVSLGVIARPTEVGAYGQVPAQPRLRWDSVAVA